MNTILPCPSGACSSLGQVGCVPSHLKQGRNFKNKVKERGSSIIVLFSVYFIKGSTDTYMYHPEGLSAKWFKIVHFTWNSIGSHGCFLSVMIF